MRSALIAGILLTAWTAAAAAAEGPISIESGRIVGFDGLAFATGTDQLKPEAAPALDALKAFLESKASITLVRIEGHAAGVPKAQALSEARARAVAAALVARGVDCQRLLPVGFGDSKPRAQTAAENTRIELAPATMRGKPIGGMPVDGGGRVAGDACKP